MSQLTVIKAHLQLGLPLTPLLALRRFGCFRLSARIHELKARGHRIRSRLIEVKGHKLSEYRML